MLLAVPRKIHWRTLPLRVAFALVGLFVTYLVVVNALLLSGLARAAINRISPENVHVQWHTAYSPWFLRVYTRGFVSFALQRGQLVPGSHARTRASGWSLWSGHDGLSGTSVVSASVPEDKPRLAIAVETYGAGVHRGKTQVAVAPSVATSARIDNLDLTKPFDRWAVSVDVPSASVKELGALNAYLGEPMLRGGSATMGGHADLAPHTVSAHAKIDVEGAVVEVRKTVVTASGTVEATLHGLDLRSGKAASPARASIFATSRGPISATGGPTSPSTRSSSRPSTA